MRQVTRLVIRSLLGLLTVMSLGSGLALAADQVPGEYLVKYKDHSFVSIASVRAIGSVRILDHNAVGKLLMVKVDSRNEAVALARLLTDSNVEYVVPNLRLHAFRAPASVQVLRDQWAMQKVNAEMAWSRAGNRGSRNVLVAIIDTGMDYNHPALKPNAVPGYDFRESDADPMDKTSAQNPGHGTHCAGIVGATGLVDGGTIGMSPEVSMMPLRFLGEDGSGDLNGAIKAIDYAIEKHANVISASWGATVGRAQAQPLVDAVKRADDAGVIMVMAAANDGKNNDTTEVYPANSGFPNTITVAASGPNDEKPSWSNYGTKSVHLAAPGLTIMSTLPGNRYENLSGTSMATPLVSGMVAFLKAQDASLTGAQARALLQQTGAQVNIQTACNCRVDSLSAVDTLLSGKMFITPAAGSMDIGEKLKFSGSHGAAPFTFEVSNPSVATIGGDGILHANATGETTVTVRDSQGQMATSLAIHISSSGTQPPPGGGGGGSCPLGDQSICDIVCQIEPTLPFCQK